METNMGTQQDSQGWPREPQAPSLTQLDAHLEVFNPGFRKLHTLFDKAEQLSLDLGKRTLIVHLSSHGHEACT